jgi:hypothetical protein
MRKTEAFLIETADHCARLAQAGRDMVVELEAMSHKLMAQAVELDTSRQRDEDKPADLRKASRK